VEGGDVANVNDLNPLIDEQDHGPFGLGVKHYLVFAADINAPPAIDMNRERSKWPPGHGIFDRLVSWLSILRPFLPLRQFSGKQDETSGGL
jgi:hypothetical protein